MKILQIIIILILAFVSSVVNGTPNDNRSLTERLSPEMKDKLTEFRTQLEIAYYHKDVKRALEMSSKIYDIDSTQGELIFADTYHWMEEYEKSIEWARKAIESAKKEKLSLTVPLMLIADSYYTTGKTKEALETLDELIKTSPDSPMGYKLYAQYYEEQNDIKNAIYYWEEALKRFKKDDFRMITRAKEKLKELRAKKRNDIFISHTFTS